MFNSEALLFNYSLPNDTPFIKAMGMGTEIEKLGELVLGMILIINLTVFFNFLYFEIKEKVYDKLIIIGILFSLGAMVNDTTCHISNYPYYFSLLGLVNFFEFFRISHFQEKVRINHTLLLENDLVLKTQIIQHNDRVQSVGEKSITSYHDISNILAVINITIARAKIELNKEVPNLERLNFLHETSAKSSDRVIDIFKGLRDDLFNTETNECGSISIDDILNDLQEIISPKLENTNLKYSKDSSLSVKVRKSDLL